MRKKFVQLLLEEMKVNGNIILLTADLGYGLLDPIRDAYPGRFYNVGSAEQLLVGMAAGLAMEKKIPVCYSITPFLLYRPFEFIRNFMQYEKLPIKLIGGGRDKDYGHLGYTHWGEEDMDVLSPFSNIQKFKPSTEDNLIISFNSFLYNNQPTYINLVK
jgi:transketolase